MIQLTTQEHNGVLYTHYTAQQKHSGVMAIAETRHIIDGLLRVTLTQGSYRYGDEIQIRILSHKDHKNVRTEPRNDSVWDTAEINIQVSEIDNLIETLLKFKEIAQK